MSGPECDHHVPNNFILCKVSLVYIIHYTPCIQGNLSGVASGIIKIPQLLYITRPAISIATKHSHMIELVCVSQCPWFEFVIRQHCQHKIFSLLNRRCSAFQSEIERPRVHLW